MPLREHAVTLAYTVAGLVCVLAMQRHALADVGGAVTRGWEASSTPDHRRRLEYEQAMRSISEIFNETASDSVNGIPGAVQLIVSTLLVLILGSLAAGAGIGGGGLFVPIYMVLLGAGPKGAVPLSKATILGGAIGNFMILGPSKHPKAKRPLIDYESSTLMQSGELLGVVFGVLLNGLLPAICIVVFLVCILSYNALRTLRKARAIRAKETAAMLKAKQATSTTKTADASPAGGSSPSASEAAPGVAEEADVLEAADVNAAVTDGAEEEAGKAEEVEEKPSLTMIDVNAATKKAAVGVEKEEMTKEVSPELQAILDDDAKQYPFWAWSLLAPMTIFTVVYAVVKIQIKEADDCSEAGYWLWYLAPLPVLGGFMLGTAYILSKRHARKVAAGFEYLPADMQWDTETLKRFPATAILAGVTAGLLGIGGGMVIGPLFLSIGMEPQVGTSSCAFMILWTAFSGVVIYGLDDHLGAELAIWCVAFGFISGQIGQRLVNAVLKKTGRPSYVVFLLGSIIGAACLAMATTLVIKMVTGDYDANDTIEENETISTHLFYLGSGLGCKSSDDYHNSSYAH